MAVRSTNNYKIAIIKETTYGAQVTAVTNAAGAVYLDSKLEWDNAPKTVELSKKENSTYKQPTRTKITGKLVTGTLSGDLTDAHEILLAAHFDDITSPYLYSAAVLDAADSYNIYKLYLNAAGACTSYDVLLGAIINPLSITGESNGVMQFSCTIDAANYMDEVTNSSGGAITLTAGIPVTGLPFLFGDATIFTPFSKITINSFNLELSKTLVDDAIRYQNSMTKTNDRYIQAGGTFSWVELWDPDANIGDQSNLYNESTSGASLILTNAGRTWEIAMQGILTAATRPDADRGILLGNYTIDLCDDGNGNAPITITTSDT